MKTFLILLDGAKGAGKSTVSLLLKDKLIKDTAFVSFDSIRHIISSTKSRTEINMIAFDVSLSMINSFLSQGVNVVFDGGIIEERLNKIRKTAKDGNSNLYLYHLSAPKDILWERIQGRTQCEKPDRKRFDYLYSILEEKDLSAFEEINTVQDNPEIIASRIYKEVMEQVGSFENSNEV